MRVVLDTTITVSALVMHKGAASTLRKFWRSGELRPMVCAGTLRRVDRVLQCPVFGLAPADREELIAGYLCFCEQCESYEGGSPLGLASREFADFLVSDDARVMELPTLVRCISLLELQLRLRIPPDQRG